MITTSIDHSTSDCNYRYGYLYFNKDTYGDSFCQFKVTTKKFIVSHSDGRSHWDTEITSKQLRDMADFMDELTKDYDKHFPAKSIVMCAFPLCGKTYTTKDYASYYRMSDSDSSKFSWIVDEETSERKRNPRFPDNYVEHIKEILPTLDIVFVSTHKDVFAALQKANINYYIVKPRVELLDEWIRRYCNRSYNGFPLQVLKDNWYQWHKDVDEAAAHPLCIKKVELEKNQYISDIIEYVVDEVKK